MVCLAATMTASLSWGFSTSLAVAMTSRALLGAFGGNTGILRTAVAEVVPWKVGYNFLLLLRRREEVQLGKENEKRG